MTRRTNLLNDKIKKSQRDYWLEKKAEPKEKPLTDWREPYPGYRKKQKILKEQRLKFIADKKLEFIRINGNPVILETKLRDETCYLEVTILGIDREGFVRVRAEGFFDDMKVCPTQLLLKEEFERMKKVEDSWFSD